MANTRTYSIVINGVEQSVKAVDSLLTKLDALDQRIQKLQKLNLNLAQNQGGTSGSNDSASKSKYDAAKSEAAAQKEVADAIALQNSENQKALQLLVKKKQETKEQVNIQKQIAQGIRDESGAYANTLQGQRQMLADMKKQLANTDLNSDDWVTLRDRVAEVNAKVKEMEESFGVFQRNVGNYKSAAEGFQGFNITIGETVRNFDSLRGALRTLKNEQSALDTTTEEGRAQFEAYNQAIKDVTTAQAQMDDAAQRAATSCKGLHDVLEMMEGLTAVAGIGQGISSLFGLDDSGLGEQIAKLQSLMMILQSIKTLQDQMERGIGGGGWIAKLWQGIDKAFASVTKLNTGLKTTKTNLTAAGTAGNAGAAGMTLFSVATKGATVAVKAFFKATILLGVLSAIVEIVDLLIDGFKELGKWLWSFVSDSERTERAMDNMGAIAKNSADALQAYNNELSRKVEAGVISSTDAALESIQKFHEELRKGIKDLKVLFDENSDVFEDANGLSLTKTADDAIDNLKRVGKAFEDMDKSASDYNEKLKHHGKNIVLEMIQIGSQSTEELQKFINALNSDAIGQTALEQMMYDLPKKSFDAFSAMRDNFFTNADSMANRAAQLEGEIMGVLKQIENEYNRAYNMSKYIADQYNSMRSYVGLAYNLGKISYEQMGEYNAQIDKLETDRQKKEKENQNRQTRTVHSGGRARVKATKSHGSARVSAAKDIASKLEAIEKRIQNDKIQAMREGLGKTLAQLDLERRNRIEQAEKTRKELGKNNKEAEEKYQRELLSIQNLYSKKEFDIKKEWTDKWTDYQEQVMRETEQLSRAYSDLAFKQLSNMNANWLDKETKDAEVDIIKRLVQRVKIADDEMKRILKETGVKDLLEKYIKNPTDETLQEVARILDEYEISLRETFDSKGKPQYSFYYTDDEEYYKTLTRLHEIGNELKKLYEQMNELGEPNDEESSRKYDELWQQAVKLKNEYDELYNSFDKSSMALSNPEFRFLDWKSYYASLYDIQKQYAEKTKALSLEQIDTGAENAKFDEDQAYEKAYKDIEEKYKQHYQDIEDEYDRHLEEMQSMNNEAVKAALNYAGEMGEAFGWESEEYANALAEYEALIPEQIALVRERDEKLKALEDEKNSTLEYREELHRITIKRIEENANEEKLKIQNDFIRESQTAMANYYSGLLNEFQMFQNRFVQKANNLQEKSKNAWGILDLSKYSKGINDLKATFKNLLKSIDDEQNELIRKLGANEISLGDFNSAYNELEDLKEEANETIETLTKMGKNKIGEFIESINQYIQAVGQGAQELLSTVWDAQSAALDAQQEALEKANQELDKQLQKQEDITRKHADKINAIEDELSTARGDRRQHLIDALSAQISAQRASLAAEQRIQKQKEANEKKMEALEKKRKEAQRKQDIISATISAALATVNGLATQPFVPTGIAMGSLAAALGAAQVAIIASKHYAKGGRLDGGVADGPRHSQGGIKVLGGRAEIEGGEFITNRRTTKQNVGVLDFINSKKRKLNLGDFVEYYSTVGRKSVTGVRSRFADGGTLPDLNTDTDWGGLIQTVVVDRDDRPIWVSVKEISDVQSDVKRVQAMAGMGR